MCSPGLNSQIDIAKHGMTRGNDAHVFKVDGYSVGARLLWSNRLNTTLLNSPERFEEPQGDVPIRRILPGDQCYFLAEAPADSEPSKPAAEQRRFRRSLPRCEASSQIASPKPARNWMVSSEITARCRFNPALVHSASKLECARRTAGCAPCVRIATKPSSASR